MKKKVSERMMIEEGKFTTKMIDKLKKYYENLRGKKLSLSKNVELEKIVRQLAKDKEALVQLVKADIPFISMNARLILNKDHGVPLNKYEEVEMDEAVSKFMSGEVGIKGKRVKVEVEVTGVDNKKRIYHAKVLSPKEHFGTDLNIPAKVMHRGTWLKTKTGKAFEGVDWKKFDTPYEGRHGKKFDTWDEWEKVEKEHGKLEKSQNKKKQKKRNKTYEQYIKKVKGSTAELTSDRLNPPTIGHEKLLTVLASAATKQRKEGMEYTTEDIEEINSLIEEIDTLCKNSTVPILREDQMCEFLLLKKAVSEDKIEELRIQAEASKVPSKGLSPAQRRKMALRMKIMAKKPGFIMKRLRALKRAATKAVITVRARKAAIKMVVKKFFPKLRTKKTSELSYSERGKISQIVKKKAKVIDRFAKKLLITTRKKDVERRRAMSGRQDKAGVKGES
ncbi:hypothetical protein HX858_08995 [Marine Group I thaumarchaeote]|uniref:Uncharacterized protein n=1 Tax=Marine Group I thaumarchaeote TaxID=2511932 RepID=A0A7K4MWH3_9ARCH|nr:hypothetical protein [Marine Group I thaumarchaeote]